MAPQEALSDARTRQPPSMPNNAPTVAMTPIATAPHKVTRAALRHTLAPPARAETMRSP